MRAAQRLLEEEASWTRPDIPPRAKIFNASSWQSRVGGGRAKSSMNEVARIVGVGRGGMPRPPESEVAKNAVPQQVLKRRVGV